MLTTLVEGVEGGKWFRLIDKIFSERNLLASFQQVASKKGTAGVDHVTTDEFGRRLPENIGQLSAALKSSTFQPRAIRRVNIPKPGTNETRPLGIPTVRDRVVQAAVVNAIEPIFECDFAEQSYGFRPRRGCKDALRRVDQLLKAVIPLALQIEMISPLLSRESNYLIHGRNEKTSTCWMPT